MYKVLYKPINTKGIYKHIKIKNMNLKILNLRVMNLFHLYMI